jgi:acyl-CoA hydrolase
MRHARSFVVTVAMDSMTFMEPIYVGNVVTLEAEVTYVGRTSIETRVVVIAEKPLTGETTITNVAYLVYVALDSQGRPQPVVPLLATNAEERARMEAARERQEYRKQQRAREQQGRQAVDAGASVSGPGGAPGGEHV